jgi:hypothetical protein
VADPIKPFFFANKEFSCFFACKFTRLLQIEKKSLIVKWRNLTPKKRKKYKKIFLSHGFQ